MTKPTIPFVAIVDDDARLLASLGGLVESADAVSAGSLLGSVVADRAKRIFGSQGD